MTNDKLREALAGVDIPALMSAIEWAERMESEYKTTPTMRKQCGLLANAARAALAAPVEAEPVAQVARSPEGFTTLDEYTHEALKDHATAVAMWEAAKELIRERAAPVEAEPVATIADYEEVLADHRRLVREMDALMNDGHAAPQASLCDLVAQMRQRVNAHPAEQGKDAEDAARYRFLRKYENADFLRFPLPCYGQFLDLQVDEARNAKPAKGG